MRWKALLKMATVSSEGRAFVLKDDETFGFITLEPVGCVNDGLVAGGTTW
jgi:hypothetical protein